jgi:hypothetical protein
VSGPHANACAGAACCTLAVGPAAAGACLVLMLMLVLALLVALWLFGLQLLVRQDQMLALLLLRSGC